MNTIQLGWACLIISHIYRANDKDRKGFIWLGLAVISILLGILCD